MAQTRVKTGAVVIGRNEGQRLLKCLKSVRDNVDCVVYVDSGSTDSSRESATKLGFEVVSLNLSQPFTAARARNAGYDRLTEITTGIRYIQFVDGDCEVVSGWISRAVETLENAPNIGIVCGRRRERNPARSVYNKLCDLEWDTPVGYTRFCGGDFLVRQTAFHQVEGFNPTLIAGEEPDLCHRLQQRGWKVLRIDQEMTLHDANMIRFGQWWVRNVRSGHAYAEAAWLHFRESGHDWGKLSLRIWLWGGIIPVVILSTSVIHPTLLTAVVVYPIQIARIAFREGVTSRLSWSYAFFVTLGKFPELQGQLKYLFSKISRSKSTIIEYK